MVACGKDHTLAIIEESHVPIQFARDGNDEALCYWLENNPKMRDLDNASLKTELGSICIPINFQYYDFYDCG